MVAYIGSRAAEADQPIQIGCLRTDDRTDHDGFGKRGRRSYDGIKVGEPGQSEAHGKVCGSIHGIVVILLSFQAVVIVYYSV